MKRGGTFFSHFSEGNKKWGEGGGGNWLFIPFLLGEKVCWLLLTVKAGGVRLSDNVLHQYETFKYTINYSKQARKNNWKSWQSCHKMTKKIDCCFLSPILVWCACHVCLLNWSSDKHNTVKNLMHLCVFFYHYSKGTWCYFLFFEIQRHIHLYFIMF